MEEPFRQSLMFYLFRFVFLLCALIHLHSHIKGILHSGNTPSMSGFTALIRILLFRAVVRIWVIWISWLAWEPPVKLEIRCFAASFFKINLPFLLPLACLTLLLSTCIQMASHASSTGNQKEGSHCSVNGIATLWHRAECGHLNNHASKCWPPPRGHW